MNDGQAAVNNQAKVFISDLKGLKQALLNRKQLCNATPAAKLYDDVIGLFMGQQRKKTRLFLIQSKKG